MNCLAGVSFWDGRDILTAGPTFLLKKTLWLAQRRQSGTIRACSSSASAVGPGKGVNVFLVKKAAKDEHGREFDPSPRDRFSPYKRGLIKTIKLCCHDKRVCSPRRSPRPFLFESNGGGIAAVLSAVS